MRKMAGAGFQPELRQPSQLPLSTGAVEELRLALIAFKRTYNQSWILERHSYKAPAQVRAEQISPMPMAA